MFILFISVLRWLIEPGYAGLIKLCLVNSM